MALEKTEDVVATGPRMPRNIGLPLPPQSAPPPGLGLLTAPVVAATTLAHSMANRGCGHIVLVGSLVEYFPLPMAPTYSGTKTGLTIFAEALRLRQKTRGVAVTLVSPGFIDTPMSRSLASPKPFMMSADDAARRIAKKIVRRPRRITFPWPLAVICAGARFLPRSIISAALQRF